MLLEIILELLLHPAVHIRAGASGCEVFAGLMAITRALNAAGAQSVPFDKEYSKWMDINEPYGFLLIILMVLRMFLNSAKTGDEAVLWLAPLCSSWVFMCRGVSMRSRVTPHGDTSVPLVAASNEMVAKTALLLKLADALGVAWVLEQPESSVLNFHERFQWTLAQCVVWFINNICMSAFGGDTMKPLKLWSNRRWVEELFAEPVKLAKKSNLTMKWTGQQGKLRSCGNRKTLKQSQAYPPAFGRRVAQVFLRNRKHDGQRMVMAQSASSVRQMLANARQTDQDRWDDAKMGRVLAYLRAN